MGRGGKRKYAFFVCEKYSTFYFQRIHCLPTQYHIGNIVKKVIASLTAYGNVNLGILLEVQGGAAEPGVDGPAPGIPGLNQWKNKRQTLFKDLRQGIVRRVSDLK